jgi:hypothetical protein
VECKEKETKNLTPYVPLSTNVERGIKGGEVSSGRIHATVSYYGRKNKTHPLWFPLSF